MENKTSTTWEAVNCALRADKYTCLESQLTTTRITILQASGGRWVMKPIETKFHTLSGMGRGCNIP